MSSELSIRATIEKARKKEKKYEWLQAARSYEEALHSESITFSFAAETWERIGFCYSRASTQTEDLKEFKKIRQLAAEAYKSAAKLFESEASLKNQGKSAQCNAIAEYVLSWLVSNPSEKRKILDQCCSFGKKSLEAYEKTEDQLSYGKMCNDLLQCLFERFHVAIDWEETSKIGREAINYADKAIEVLSNLDDKNELLRAYFMGSLQSWYAYIVEEEERRKELMRKSLSYSQKALDLSREVDNPYYTAMSNWAVAFGHLLFTEKAELAMEYASEMLKQGTIVRDNYLKGVASFILAFVTDWMIPGVEDRDKKMEEHRKIIKYGEDAIRYLQLVCQDYFIAETYLFYGETYSSLAREAATSLKEKQDVSKKAVEIGRKGLEHAIRSGSLDAMVSTLHALSKALHFCSYLGIGKDEKTKLLEEALLHRREYINIAEKAFPFNDWLRGVGKNYEGLIQVELARIETDKAKKTALLKSAVLDMEDGVSHCRKWVSSRPAPSQIATVAGFEETFGGILDELHLLTGDNAFLTKAIEVYDDAAIKFNELTLPTRVAESYWKIAKNQDRLDNHRKAAENFDNAFTEYKAAAQKIAQFSDFYLDYAAYMKAWSEFEEAKLAHKNGDYATAMKHYENAANLLKQSKSWGYMSSNFLAWSLLEHAEDLSRKEESKESIEAFKNANELFREAKRTFRVELDKIENEDEKDLAKRLIEALDTREKYCSGRMVVEEAKILDRQGDHSESSEKFGFAAETFQKTFEVGSEQTRKELTPLIFLCQAWKKMMMAEAKSSPTIYREAAELFEKAGECSLDQLTSLLALAHSSFCRALEVGTAFENTRDLTLHSEARKHMDVAANYYLKAGFESGSEYVKATQLLFDAYVYIDSANRETNPEKEAKYYIMAEKVLRISADLYDKAKHPKKAEQVQRLLMKVGEERELAVSLSEVLYAPKITSSTASFSMLTPSEEKAVGLERFEHADVQVKLNPYAKEISVGEDLGLDMQIANLGKEAVQLARIEEMVPAGFWLVAKPDYCRSEDSYFDMNGKRLDPLKTEEIKLVLRSLDKGTFDIKPRIVCIDETGHQTTWGPEPVTITVSQAILPRRLSTGYGDLDNLLFGGIPENYAVILSSPSCDERDQVIKSFLEAGVKNGQVTFYVTAEAGGIRALAEEFQSNFFVILCNPRADTMIGNLPNVFKLKGVENLTDIDIALTRAFRTLETSPSGPRRACIEIVSDVLLQHHAVSTRRWLVALIPDLKSRGFTTLAVMNLLMHPSEEVHAILGLFEGEINVYEKETPKGLQRFLKIRKLYNQKYLDSELPLKRKHGN